jgi:hypothetical protein
MVLPVTVKKWNVCVEQAKQRLNIKGSWGYLSGAALKDAQKCYCAMSFIKNKNK